MTAPTPWTQVPATIAEQRSGGRWPAAAVTLAVLAAPAAWAWSSGELGLATVWALVGLALAAWVAGPTPWPTFLPAPGPGARLPVAALALVAAYSAAAGHSLVRALVPYAVALALPLLSRLGGGAVDRAAAWFGRTVGHVVSTVLFTLLGLLTVALPWLVQRTLRIDPLHQTTSWNRRARRAMQPGQPWAPSPIRTTRTTAERVRNLVLTAAVVVGLLVATPVGRLLVQTVSGRVTSAARPFQLDLAPEDNGENLVPRDAVPEGVTETPHDPDAPQAAMVTSEWLEDGVYQSAQGWALDPRNAWRPVNPHRLQDFTSRDLSIRNGERRTWAPPASGQTRLTVWMFGGSTTYGLNQRDDHTIASELARAAAANGIELDIHNKGNNGQLHWMESERFAWDLTTEPAPDLVLFYDGVNETWEGSTLNRFSTGDVPDMYDPTLLDAWENGREGTSTDAPAAPPGARLVGRPRGPVLGPVQEHGDCALAPRALLLAAQPLQQAARPVRAPLRHLEREQRTGFGAAEGQVPAEGRDRPLRLAPGHHRTAVHRRRPPQRRGCTVDRRQDVHKDQGRPAGAGRGQEGDAVRLARHLATMVLESFRFSASHRQWSVIAVFVLGLLLLGLALGAQSVAPLVLYPFA